jgi:hypothetical protein
LVGTDRCGKDPDEVCCGDEADCQAMILDNPGFADITLDNMVYDLQKVQNGWYARIQPACPSFSEGLDLCTENGGDCRFTKCPKLFG